MLGLARQKRTAGKGNIMLDWLKTIALEAEYGLAHGYIKIAQQINCYASMSNLLGCYTCGGD